jgi:hypothetical protein
MKKGFFRPVPDLKIERKNPGGAVQFGSVLFQKKEAFLSMGKGSTLRPFLDFQQQHCLKLAKSCCRKSRKGLKANPYPIFSNLSLSPIDELVRVCFVD